MKQNAKKGFIVLCVLVAVAAVSLIHPLRTRSASTRESRQPPAHKKGTIAELHITGVITEAGQTYNQKWLMDTIAELTEDSRNRAIMLYIDSPGGAVYEADEVYLALLKYKAKTSRPVYAYMAHMATSGGYYIACAADKIFANRNTLTGSIGVLFSGSVDATGLLDKLGIKSETFHSGKNKNMLNYNEPLTNEQRAIMQSVADEAYAQFTGIVSESRALPLSEVQSLADGRIYTAQQALKNGLIDSVCQKEEAYELLKRDFALTGASVKEYSYEEDNFLRSLLLGSARTAIKGALLSLSGKLDLSALPRM